MANELYIHTLRQLRDGCKAEHMDTETAALEAAIQALSCNGDCISRQEAKDAIRKEWDGCCSEYDAGTIIYDTVEAIDRLPSVQPDLQPTCNQVATDCISRQQAIKEAESLVGLNGYEQHLQRDVVEWLKELPSAQPERTCVNCGRTVNNGGWYADGRTRCPIEEHYALLKDGYCHLWEKRNVTDDDYPEGRADE